MIRGDSEFIFFFKGMLKILVLGGSREVFSSFLLIRALSVFHFLFFFIGAVGFTVNFRTVSNHSFIDLLTYLNHFLLEVYTSWVVLILLRVLISPGLLGSSAVFSSWGAVLPFPQF